VQAEGESSTAAVRCVVVIVVDRLRTMYSPSNVKDWITCYENLVYVSRLNLKSKSKKENLFVPKNTELFLTFSCALRVSTYLHDQDQGNTLNTLRFATKKYCKEIEQETPANPIQRCRIRIPFRHRILRESSKV
jgi:hypothetical protein